MFRTSKTSLGLAMLWSRPSTCCLPAANGDMAAEGCKRGAVPKIICHASAVPTYCKQATKRSGVTS